ncbi:hypothetical protein MPF94_04090 [Helicobacter pylori]|uniref:hypothetical protein n=1 Tax=Helicobacter pylori TaxID=210 RepID=UPI001FD4CEF0|nr:hypothetical protein [Helicobacter pylori]UOR37133.1 hypothetical protein MPF94_04090 [Helicobacter pylori]
MKQKVHSVSYLAKAEFSLKDGVHDLVALPAGAEVVKVSLEVVKESLEVVGFPADSHIDVGFKDEAEKKYFLTLRLDNPLTPNQQGRATKIAMSDKDYTATSNKVVAANVQVGNYDGSGNAKGVLRVVYFLPSMIEVEY